MPFISAEQLDSEISQEKLNKQIENKKKLNSVNEKAKPEEHFAKEMFKQQQKAPKQISPKDLLNSIKKNEIIDDYEKHAVEKYVSTKDMTDIKGMALDIATMPQKDERKRQIFKSKLEQSSIIDGYLNDNIIQFASYNKHLQASAIYALKYYETSRM